MACYECLRAWFLNSPDNGSQLSLVSEDDDAAPPPHHHHHHNNDTDADANANGTAALATRNVTRLKKHCPYCRVAVNTRPVPVYALRDLVDIIDPENALKNAEQPNDPWKNIFPAIKTSNVGTLNGSDTSNNNIIGEIRSRTVEFPPDIPPPPFYDPEDQVRRCGVCMHEIWGQTCSNERCGTVYEDDSDYHSESDEDYNGPLEPWHGFPFGTIENVHHDGSYESSFIDDDDDDIHGNNEDEGGYDAHLSIWSHLFNHHFEANMSSEDDDDDEAVNELAQLESTSRNRARSSIIREDSDEDVNTDYSRSSDDFISRDVLKDRSGSLHGSVASSEDEIEIENKNKNESASASENGHLENSSQLSRQISRRGFSDDDGVILEEDSEPISWAQFGGASCVNRDVFIRRRLVVSDRDSSSSSSMEEDEDEDEDEDEEGIPTPSRNHSRRGRRIMSDEDEGGATSEDEDSEPVRPRGVRRRLRAGASEHTTHRRR